jgi:O-antigen/teichoic acid export membrane protein
MAPSIAHFFGEPQIIPILQVMSLSFLIVPFGNVQKKLLSKELRFRKLFYLGLITTFVHGSVSVTLALCGFGVWSFVYGFLSAIIVDMLFVWRLLSWRPKWHYNMQIAKEMLGFGGTVSSEGILSWAVNTIDDVLVGKWLGGASLGMYRMGFKLGILPAKNITSPLLKVLFPAFSKLQEDRIELKRAFLKAMKHISVITFPMSVGIATTANLFIPLLLGEKWSPTVPIVQILALYGIFMSIGSLIPQAYKAIGRPDIYLKYVSVRSIFTLPVFYCVVPYGLVALSAAHLILTLIFFPVNFYIGLKVMSISFEEVYDSLKVSVTYSVCVLFLVVILEKFFLYSVHLSQGWTLGLLILSAVSLYCTLLYLSRKTFLEIKGLVLRTITG